MSTLFKKVKEAVQNYNVLIHYEQLSIKFLGEKRVFDKTRSLNAVIDAYRNYLANDNQTKEHRKLWTDIKGFVYYNQNFDHMHVPVHQDIQFTEFKLPESENKE